MDDQLEDIQSPSLAALNETVNDDEALSLEDFYADMKSRQFMYVPARELWPTASVDARLPPMIVRDVTGNAVIDEKGKPKKIPASKWLASNRPVEQMSWIPGAPLVPRDRSIEWQLCAESVIPGLWLLTVAHAAEQPSVNGGQEDSRPPYCYGLKT